MIGGVRANYQPTLYACVCGGGGGDGSGRAVQAKRDCRLSR